MIDASLDDRRLVSRLLDGDEAAFDALIDQYYPRLYRFAYSRLSGDGDAAEEIVQATLVKIIENLSKFRGEASLFTWMCAFCRFEIAASWRKKSGRGNAVELREDAPEIRAALDSLSMGSRTPESELERSELARLVRTTLDHLPPKYGEALEMKYVARLSVREIARRMNLSPKAAESLLTRSRNAFKEGFASLTGWDGDGHETPG